MAYTINRWSGPSVATVNDGTVNESLDIKLIGKNYAGYGELQNENMVHMLENFAGPLEPSKAISGQIWFDTSVKKIKVFTGDVTTAGKVWKSVGGANVSATEPVAPTQGDLWLDTFKSQLKVRTANNTWLTVGPQTVGTTTTQMVSRNVNGRPFIGGDVISYPIIAATVDDEVLYIISRSEFLLDTSDPESNIPGYTTIKKGLTLAYTNSNGVTNLTDDETPSSVFWGTVSYALTARDSDLLNGYTSDDFVRQNSANFSVLAHFVDAGLAVGNEDDLRVFVKEDSDLVDPDGRVPVIAATGYNIEFNVRYPTSTLVPLRITDTGLVPGATASFNLGTTSTRWNTVYAARFDGTSTVAERLVFNNGSVVAAATSTGNTLVVRNENGDISARRFVGVSEQADTLKVGTEYRLATASATPDTIVVRNASGSIDSDITGTAQGANSLFFNGSPIAPTSTSMPLTLVVRDASSAISASGFIGSGALLSSLNANNLTAGIIPTSRLTGTYTININGVANSALAATTAQKADSLKFGSDYITGATSAGAYTVAVRDSGGNLTANLFNGVATNANALKFGASYLTTAETATGTTVVIRSSAGDIYANVFHGTATNSQKADTLLVGASYRSTSTAANIDTIAVRDSSGNLTANVFNGVATSATTTTYVKVSGVDRVADTSSSAYTIAARTSSGDLYANVFHGTATQAQYADLAEKYLTDADYEPGTVVVVGGEKEVTACSTGQLAIGVVSTCPAYMMNSELLGGTYIALKGRVPVKVEGPVRKGQRLIAGNNGCALGASGAHIDVFAIALEDNNEPGVSVVEAVIL